MPLSAGVHHLRKISIAKRDGHTVVSQVSAHSRVSAQVAVLPSRMESTHSRVSAQVRCA